MEIEGKVGVITGAASGIGLGIARSLAAGGANLVLADIEQDPLDEVASELAVAGAEVIAVRTDVSKLDQVEALADSALAKFDGVHVLCNNAGVGVSGPVAQTSIEDWRWTLDIDLWGPIYGVQVFAPIMERQGEGHINSTASMAGLYSSPSLGAYNVAKHGVVALMASLERDFRLAGSGLRASVLCPGPVNTNIIDSERNRDAASAAQHVQTPTGDQFWSMLTEALAEGMDPDDVGPMIVEAIRDDKFWVLTHPSMAEIVARQTSAMLDDQSLVR